MAIAQPSVDRERPPGDIAEVDPELADLVREEERRQATTLMLIPSENYSSLAVRQAQGGFMIRRAAVALATLTG